MLPYERFDAWKKAHALALAIYQRTASWPKEERFGLTAQIRRSAFSVPANLVEGQARRGRKEFRRFLDIAWGSLAEVGYTLRYARDLGYLTEEAYAQLQALRDEAGPPLFGLLRSMGNASNDPE